jgi:hypothetical protein
MERRREEGIAQARFDAGGLTGDDLAEQEGGEPETVVPATAAAHGEAADSADAETKPIEEVLPKRGRKKTVAEAEAEEAPAKEMIPVALSPTKRTFQKTEATHEPEEFEEKPEDKPKRGRPKKAESAHPTPEPDEAEEKPKRGRPKKLEAEN